MNDLVRRVQKAIKDRRLLADGDAVVVAVSGGVDSMVLLHTLHALSRTHRWKLVVGHFNHLLRGRESDADERLVARTAAKLGLAFECSRGDVKQFAAERKISIEMAARALRHDFLARTARQLGVRHVALAHHGEDQVELFFVRLFRGAGTDGLGGMKWSAPSPVDREVTLVRPFLGEAKTELLQFARAGGVQFRHDRSNRSMDILRNRIRHELLPLLRKSYQPDLHPTVLRAMELLRADAEFIDATAGTWLKKRHRKAWDSIPVAVQRAVIHNELLRLGIRPQFDWVEQLRLERRWVTLGGNTACRRNPDGTLEKRPSQRPEMDAAERLVILDGRSGNVEFGGRRFHWQLRAGAKLPRRHPSQTEYFDSTAVGNRILLRHWRPGDRFQPIGMGRPAKLQDLFVNRKVPRDLRRQLVVATTVGNEIFWVEGLRIGERFKIEPGTKQILRWQWASKE